MAEPEILAVGRIVRPHGVRGELVVEVLTDSPELRFVPGSVLGTQRRGKDRGQNLTVAAARPHAGRLLLRAEGVDGREAAEDLRGVLLTVTTDVLEPTEDPDEFHDHQLVGLRAVEPSGAEIGEVREVIHTPAGELLALRTADDREVLVPFVVEIVPEIDLAAGKLVVDPPEGLLDE
ncbi:16S rRNA processing protein RimM [Saccharopolyspora antimicrobica]|uniref:Ribosome maturation factor RimM n=1 Tax=Saccharopolyspora antimicrobica TaxID=455193 RepID=A0A1I4T3N6_9PSEU|nr:ribosome maturation factor RimM [Saccharopolyspora antimicrobica]RKT85890.1 16S rRNA processing protein RimM [Saccharopolyspora antimicrobica]SFM71160.1 16S rRNA processing protein RimM [Saccharopolyspora antimicrobica]